MEDNQHPSPRDGQQVPAPAANDEPLLDAVRNGDEQAFGELYARHRGAVFAVARLHSNSHAEAEDITSEAFTRVLALLKSGGGPRQFLRAYLVTAVSRLAADRAHDLNRTQPQEPHEQGKLDQIQLFDDTVVRQVDAAVVARAFASLPERWQEVLWYLEIEGYRPRQVASVVGMQPNAVSALGKRARDGLRTAYMQQHVSARALEECGEYSTQLGAFVRGTLTPSKLKLMQDHLDSCERCTAEYLQLQDLGVGLRGWILPILAGLPLWGDASERLLAALGAAGAGGATAVSGVVSSSTTTTPPGAGAEGTSGSSAGGVLAGSATKIIIAAAAVAVVGAGTIGIVSAFQQDSSDVANTNQAQPAVGEAGEAGDSAGQGTAADDSADSPGDSSERDAERSNDDRVSRSDTQSMSDSSGQDGGGAAAGGSGGASGDVLGGAGALLPPAGNSGSSGDNPADISVPASPGAPSNPQLDIPVTPSLPGLELPGDTQTSEATGPRDGPGTGSVVEDEVDGAPDVPGTGESPEPPLTPDPDNPATGESGTDDSGAGDPGANEPDGDEPVAGDPGAGESGTDGPDAPGAEEPGVGEPGTGDPDVPSGNNGNTDPGGTGNTDPEGTGNTNPGGTGNTNPGGTGTTPGGTGTTTPGGTGNTNPGTPPSNPGEGTPVTPGTPSSPEDPPTTDPGTQPTAPNVDPTGPPPTTAPVQPTPTPVPPAEPTTPPAQPTPTPVPPVEPTTPPAQPTPPVVPPDEPIGDRGEDLTDPSEPITGWWGTVPRGWTLIDWIVFLLTGVRP